MATVIWKDGESELCDPHLVQYQLQAGWSLENENEILSSAANGQETKNNDGADAIAEPEEKIQDEKEDAEREELLAMADELGLKFRSDIKTETLSKKVEQALSDDSN